MHAWMQTYIYLHAHTCRCTQTCTHTGIYAHMMTVYAHAYTHAHTHAQVNCRKDKERTIFYLSLFVTFAYCRKYCIALDPPSCINDPNTCQGIKANCDSSVSLSSSLFSFPFFFLKQITGKNMSFIDRSGIKQ